MMTPQQQKKYVTALAILLGLTLVLSLVAPLLVR